MLLQPHREQITLHDAELCGIGFAQFTGVVNIAQCAGVILHQIGCGNIQKLLQLQIVIVPDAPQTTVFRVDMAEADHAAFKAGTGMLLTKRSERTVKRICQILSAPLLFLWK